MSTAAQEEAAVDRFAGMMCQRLAENRHKTHWRHGGQPFPDLLRLLREEVEDLAGAIEDNIVNDTGALNPIIRSRSADAANFAMMLYDLTLEEAV